MDSAQETSRTSPNALQILISARDLIRDTKNWAQRAEALTVQGERVSPLNESASRFCAGGAVVKIAKGYSDGGQFALITLNAATHAWYRGGLTAVNDFTGHRAIMHVFDEAIQMLSPKT